MISRALSAVFRLNYVYDTPLQRQRARGVFIINWASLVVFCIFILFAGLLPGQVFGPEETAAFSTQLVAFLAIFLALQNGRLQLASLTLVAFSLVVIGIILFGSKIPNDQFFFSALLIPLVISGIVLRRVGIISVGGVMFALILVETLYRVQRADIALQDAFTRLILMLVVTLLITAIQAVFRQGEQALSELAQTNMNRMRRVISVNTRVGNLQTELAVLNEAINLVRSDFGYDFAQIYLVDEAGRLTRRVRTGERRLESVSLQEILTLGDTNAISEAARMKAPVQVSINDPQNRREHFLPTIQRGIALPMLFNGQLIGVLDIQNTRITSFEPTEIEVLQLLSEQIAGVLNRIQGLEALQGQLQAAEALANQLQIQVSTLQAQRQQLLTGAWSEYIEQAGQSAIGFNWQGGTLTPASEMPPAMRRSLLNEDMYTQVDGEFKLISVPIKLRNEILGAMSFWLPVKQSLTERQLELARTIALRLGNALENARLLEQTQAQATRERKAGQAAGLLIGATDVNSLLELAANTFNEALGAIQTQVYIEPLRSDAGRTSILNPKPNGKKGHSDNA
ncbi:MAG: GAF domain-containing protein [Phototrophicaceae bacterium]